jgi:K+-transporting ATPase ATPase C chain
MKEPSMTTQLRPTLLAFVLLTFATGVIYPLLVTAIASVVFPTQAAGSLIQHQGRVVGSSLIGQSFGGARYFWSRPSATGPAPYNAAAGACSSAA